MQKIPIIIDASGNVTGQNIFLSSIFDSYQTYLKKQADISNDYEALIDVVKENVELIVDADTANGVTENMGKLQHIWDSKLKAGLMIRDKCNSLGLKLNKLTKKYESADAAATA